MQGQLLLALYSLSVASNHVAAMPAPQLLTAEGGLVEDLTVSCPTEDLNEDTWKKLSLDTWLKDWAAANVTTATSNNVQALAKSFGAPNFFCGLDHFCNAGQPCVPVELPAWYGLIAVQNWNSYMNSVNTAIGFASSILSLTLPEIVNDLWAEPPKDNITPLLKIVKSITTVIGLVPFTGAASTVAGGITGTVGYLTTLAKPPAAEDKFLRWSNVASSVGEAVQAYQASLSDSIDRTLDAPVGDDGGILGQLQGGRFLGVSKNVTQSQLQSQMIDSFKVYAAGLALQAQKIYVVRVTNGPECSSRETEFSYMDCITTDTDEGVVRISLDKSDDTGNTQGQGSIADALASKYGITKKRFLYEVYDCFVANGKKQVVDNFGDFIPLDPATKCLFHLQVCEKSANDLTGIADACRNKGLDV